MLNHRSILRVSANRPIRLAFSLSHGADAGWAALGAHRFAQRQSRRSSGRNGPTSRLRPISGAYSIRRNLSAQPS